MINGLKAIAKRFWPALRLRAILFTVLFFVAAMPGIGAIFLRVYENTLVRQTEAELMAQGAALVAVAETGWPGRVAPVGVGGPKRAGYYAPEDSKIDLSSSDVLPERPRAPPATTSVDATVEAAAKLLRPVTDRTSQTTLASIILVDRNGRVVIGSEAGGSYWALPEVQKALKGSPQTVLRRVGEYRPVYAFEWISRASALRVHHARPIVVDGKVVGVLLLSRSARALFRGIYEDRGKIAIGVGVIFAILVVLAGLVSRGIARPIEALSAAAREVAAGQGSIPETPVTAAIEIRALYEEFRVMAEAIARRSRYLRDFAAAVSHEFKTPLAGIAGAIELLEDHHAEMSEDERNRFLANISADTARLSQLVTRLLDLARADMAQPETGVAVDLSEAAHRVADAQRGPGFEVVVDLPKGLPLVAAPEPTIETVLTTLAENSRQAGAVRLTIAASVSETEVVVSVIDDGPGIPPADRARLFEPFFTSHRADGGTGLGLSIARSLLAASNGRIAAVETLRGARFEVTLPRP
ncbi:ATP-binding protein [soil metagenome]